jgi:sodium/potassium-transporting ATPase subunit alpha
MVTGDQPLTATAIARQVSIITEAKTCNEIADEKGLHFSEVLDESDAVVVHGLELSKFVEEDKDLPFEEQRLTLFLQKKEVVFARTSPAQKYMIVDCAQKLKHIVAVTGDGVNDSPAIKKADIGIAMAIVGSDVAKDAADMLLMDDNFASIVDGVREGRKVFDNLKKSIAYTLASNIPELAPFLSLVIFQIPLPLSTVLILCIDLGTDIVPAVSLAYEDPELDIMNHKPRNALDEHLVSGKLLMNAYMVIGVFQTMAGYLAYFVVLYDYGMPPWNLFFLGLSTKGTKPGDDDVYNKHSKYKGNSKVGTSNDGVQVDYISTNDAKWDLRIWYWYIDTWKECRFPDDVSPVSGERVCYSTEALKYAQYSFFLAIVGVQWVNLIIVKTKRLSIVHHGLRNIVSFYGFLSETVITLIIGFTPGIDVSLGGRPLHFLHWYFPSFPIIILIFCYDEVRKMIIRYQAKKRKENGIEKLDWVELNTLY